jgi:cholesterol transport system auxiliary component
VREAAGARVRSESSGAGQVLSLSGRPDAASTAAERRRAALGAAWAALVALAAVGCLGQALDGRPPERQSFVLDPGTPPVLDTMTAIRALRVGPVASAPLAERQPFLLRTGPDSYQTDFYDQFFAPPGELLRDALIRWLDGTGLFDSVARGGVPAPDFVLEVQLERLYGDRLDPHAPKAVLGFVARLVDARQGDGTLVFERRYEETEPAADGSPQALVDAWNRALTRALDALTHDLRAALSTPAPKATRAH